MGFKVRDEDGEPVRRGWTYRAGGYRYEFIQAVSRDVVRVKVTTPAGRTFTEEVFASGLGLTVR